MTTSAVSGQFIVLEGADGVGKTTQTALLSSWMKSREIEHVVAREPGGTPLGEAVRDLILRETDLHIAPEPELLLILASRAAFVSEVVKPALAAGKAVLADRFALSTLAYQGYGRGLPLDDVRDGLRIATGGLEPDLYIILDIPIEESSARQAASGVELDRIESEGDGFLQSVRQGYLALGDSESGVRVLNGSGPPEAVQDRVRELLIEIFPETFGGSAL
ncbi:MAG TPA: dTMP kinase [Gemmatimonadetes bacterium]|nr:dTMP kinase [Gemmatimonadota bacterium]